MSLFNLLFGCPHKRTSFPQTQPGKRKEGPYVVCTDCGKEFPYDWTTMQMRTELRLQEVSRKPEQKGTLLEMSAERKVR